MDPAVLLHTKINILTESYSRGSIYKALILNNIYVLPTPVTVTPDKTGRLPFSATHYPVALVKQYGHSAQTG